MKNESHFGRQFYLVIIGVITGVLILLLLYNLRTIFAEQKQNEKEDIQMLNLYNTSVGNSLDQIEKMVITESMENDFVYKINHPRSRLQQLLTLSEKQEYLENEIEKYEYLAGMIIYVPDKDFYLGVKSDSVSSEENTLIRDSMSSILAQYESALADYWFNVCIDDSYYSFCMVSVDDIYFAAWVKPSTMTETLMDTEKEDLYCLLDKEGHILNRRLTMKEYTGKTAEIDDTSYIVRSPDIKNEKMYLAHFIKKNDIYSNMFMKLFLMIGILFELAVIILVISLFISDKVVISPMEKAFVDSEEQKKEAIIRYLQIQAKPHFINNCLSLIRNLILLDRDDEAEKVILLLSQYTRNSLTMQTEIALDEEMAHVKVYCDLQKERYMDRFEINISRDPDLGNPMVPSMMIQTFIGNSIKHQLKKNEILKITLDMRLSTDRRYILFLIQDNGCGFSEDILKILNEYAPVIDDEGNTHIGIYNVVERIHLLYGNDSDITFANNDSGSAMISIKLPYKGE